MKRKTNLRVCRRENTDIYETNKKPTKQKNPKPIQKWQKGQSEQCYDFGILSKI